MGGRASVGDDEDVAPSRYVSLLEEWSRRYRPPLIRFFQRRMPPADHEDLV